MRFAQGFSSQMHYEFRFTVMLGSHHDHLHAGSHHTCSQALPSEVKLKF